MKRTFKPNVEKLEDRLVMSAATEELYGNFHFRPAAQPEASLTRTMADIDPGSADYSAIVFVGGWGASSYQYAFSGTYSNTAFGHAGDDVLIGGEGRDVEEGVCHGVSVLAWARVDGASTPMLFQALTSNEQAMDTHADDMTLKGQKILQNAPEEGTDPSLESLASRGEDASAEPLPVLLVLANRDFAVADPQLQVEGRATAGDDVVVDGKIITAENFASGY